MYRDLALREVQTRIGSSTDLRLDDSWAKGSAAQLPGVTDHPTDELERSLSQARCHRRAALPGAYLVTPARGSWVFASGRGLAVGA